MVKAFWTGVLVASAFWTVGWYLGKAVWTKVWSDVSGYIDAWRQKQVHDVTTKIDEAVTKVEQKL